MTTTTQTGGAKGLVNAAQATDTAERARARAVSMSGRWERCYRREHEERLSILLKLAEQVLSAYFACDDDLTCARRESCCDAKAECLAEVLGVEGVEVVYANIQNSNHTAADLVEALQ
jgi:hypothetical protein